MNTFGSKTMGVALLGSVAALTMSATLMADEPVSATELPDAVQENLERHFPGHRVIQAHADRDDGRNEYDVKIEHGDLILDVELAENGPILDVDMD